MWEIMREINEIIHLFISAVIFSIEWINRNSAWTQKDLS